METREEKPHCNATFSTTNPAWTGVGLPNSLTHQYISRTTTSLTTDKLKK
jgi:hypothetical protein